ncbi:hypothetical protein [Novispirillum itersonii]|uniref:Uncharacterized protein n=1 Tax=Novispirillum itersonii TaxID=189 RepID=A0A7W9ZDG4_NOVIT|nr:hypothetical protein [Novispirillum itersonii]MBB6209173.1 hypothetical protein [Novispirillum itersonii]
MQVGYYDGNGVFRSVTGLTSETGSAVSGGASLTWYNVPVDQAANLVVRSKPNSDNDFRIYARAKAVDTPSDTGGTNNGAEDTRDNTAYSVPVYLQFDGKGTLDPTNASWTVAPAIGIEDPKDPVKLNLSINLVDKDGSETISAKLTGIPAGSTLYVVDAQDNKTAVTVVNNGGSLEVSGLSEDQFKNLAVDPPENYAGQFNVSVEVWTVERDLATSEIPKSNLVSLGTQTVTVRPQADEVTASGLSVTTEEDTAESLNVTFSLGDKDDTQSGAGHEEVTGIVIKLLPGSGGNASAADIAGSKWWAKIDGVETELTIVNNNGSYSIVVPAGAIKPVSGTRDTADAYKIDGLRMQPAKDSDKDIKVQYVVTTTDTATGSPVDTRIETFDGTITVKAVTEPDIDITAGPVVGKEDGSGNQFSLGLTAKTLDIDNSETVRSITISGVPDGWEIVGATSQGEGAWSVTSLSNLSNLKIKLPEHEATDGAKQLSVTVTWKDGSEGSLETKTIPLTVDITPVADMPTAVIKSVVGKEDTPLDVYINPQLVDKDGSETISVTVSGVPAGVKFGHVVGGVFVELTGAYNSGSQSWSFTKEQLSGLKLLPPEDSNRDFTMTVTVRSTERHGGDYKEFSEQVKVDIIGVADGVVGFKGENGVVQPLVNHQAIDAKGVEDQPVDLGLKNLIFKDTDGSETISYVVDLKSLPAGFTLSGVPEDAMIPLGNGRWSIDPDYISSLKLNPPKDFANNYPDGTKLSIGLEVRSTENDGDVRVETHPINITIDAVPDQPQVDSPSAGLEDGLLTIPLGVSPGDSDHSETITGLVLSSQIKGFSIKTDTGLTLEWDAVDGRYEINGEADLRAYDSLILTPDDSRKDLGGPDARVDYTLKVTVKDASGVSQPFDVNKSITVNPVADKPTVGIDDVVTDGKTVITQPGIGTPASLSLKAISGETGHTENGAVVQDHSELISLVVSGMPNGAVLVHQGGDGTWKIIGSNNGIGSDGQGSWTIDAETLNALRTETGGPLAEDAIKVWAPWGQRDENGSFTPLNSLNLTVTVIATEKDGSGAERQASSFEPVTIVWTDNSTPGGGGNPGGGGDNGGGTPGGGGNGGSGSSFGTSTVNGVEDIPVSHLGLTAPSGVSAVIISGVPDTASFSAGDRQADGTWKVDATDLATLEFIPPPDKGGKYAGTPGGGPINLSLQGVDQNGAVVNGAAGTRSILLRPEADAPTVSVATIDAVEDHAISLAQAITVTSNDSDGSETVSLLIKVPKGFMLTGLPGGVDPYDTMTAGDADGQPAFALNGDGKASYNVYAITKDQLASLSIVRDPAAADAEHYSGSLKIYVTGVSTELEGGQATTDVSHVISIKAEADGALLSANPNTGVEDGGAITLNLDAAKIDSSETITKIWISGHDAAKVSFVDGNGDPVTDLSNLTLAQLQSLKAVPADYYSGTLTFTVHATTKDGGSEKTTSQNVSVIVTPETNGATLTVTPTETGMGYDFRGDEDTAIKLDVAAALKDNDGSELLSIQIRIPVGAALVDSQGHVLSGNTGTDGNNQSVNVWVLKPDDLKDVYVVPPRDFNGDMQVKVTATGWERGLYEQSLDTNASITVKVNPVADRPDIEPPSTLSVTEGVATPLNLNIQYGAVNEKLTLMITDVPSGATFEVNGQPLGVLSGDGKTWVFDDIQVKAILNSGVGGFKIVPPPYSDADFTLRVKVVSDDNGSTASSAAADADGYRPVEVKVAAVADAPDVTAQDVVGNEGATGIPLKLGATLKDLDGSETLVVKILGVPADATLSHGTVNADGVWTVPAGALSAVQLRMSAYDSGTYTLKVVATATEGVNKDFAVTEKEFDVTVNPVANTPILTVGPVPARDEDLGGNSIPLSIEANSPDSSEAVNVTVSGFPAGATLNKGILNADGSYTVSATDLSGLTLKLPDNYNGVFSLSVSAVSQDGSVVSAPVTATTPITVRPVADIPSVTVQNVSGNDHDAIPLKITAALADVDRAETLLTVTVSGVPSGGRLSHGSPDANGNWVVQADDLHDLSFIPPANAAASYSLSVVATARDPDNGGAAVKSAGGFTVSINTVAQQPDAKGAEIVTNSGTAIPLNLSVVHTDLSETLTFTITGVPSGGSLTHATDLGNGVWSLDPAYLKDVAFTAPQGEANGHWDMVFKAVATETNGTSDFDQAALKVTVDHTATAVTIKVIDPYVQGATVFYDTDGDGVRDDNEVMGYTNEFGEVTLNVDTSVPGRFISIGGIDSATGKPVDGVFIGTGSTLTPLTTVLDSIGSQHGQSAAEWLVDKLEMDPQTLNGIDLQNFDPVATLVADGAQSAQAGDILRAGMMVQNTVSMLTSVIEGSNPGISNADAAKIALQQVVAAVDEHGLSALTTGAADLVQGALTAAGAGTLPNGLVQEMAEAISDNNAALQTQTGATGKELLANLSAVSTEAQGSVADHLHQMAETAPATQEPVAADAVTDPAAHAAVTPASATPEHPADAAAVAKAEDDAAADPKADAAAPPVEKPAEEVASGTDHAAAPASPADPAHPVDPAHPADPSLVVDAGKDQAAGTDAAAQADHGQTQPQQTGPDTWDTFLSSEQAPADHSAALQGPDASAIDSYNSLALSEHGTGAVNDSVSVDGTDAAHLIAASDTSSADMAGLDVNHGSAGDVTTPTTDDHLHATVASMSLAS